MFVQRPREIGKIGVTLVEEVGISRVASSHISQNSAQQRIHRFRRLWLYSTRSRLVDIDAQPPVE